MEKEKQEELELELEDSRKEAAIASTLCLRPDLKPVNGVTSEQLSKFQELHRRRLQIKARSKSKTHKIKKPKDRCNKFDAKDTRDMSLQLESDSNTKGKLESSSLPNLNLHTHSVNEDTEVPQLAFATKKRQKLHWGLDTKERWERKANM